MVEGILSGEAVAMRATDFLEENRAVRIEDKGGWICSFVWRIPPRPIQIRHLVVRICHENDVRGQICLLGEELFGALIEICGRSRIDQ
jgi:hypothetical protein